MQHHSSGGTKGTVLLDSATLASVRLLSCPIASASATCHSASFLIYDIVHALHFPTTFLHLFSSSSQTNLHSQSTSFMPFAMPQSFSSGWSWEKIMGCGMPQMSAFPGCGGGLLSGMMVSCKSSCFPPGFMFMLFTFRALAVRPSWAKEQSNNQMLILSECKYLKMLTASTVCTQMLDTDHQWISDKSVPLCHPLLYLLSPKSIPISITSLTPLHSSLSPLSHPSSLCSLFHWYPFPCHYDPLVFT